MADCQRHDSRRRFLGRGVAAGFALTGLSSSAWTLRPARGDEDQGGEPATKASPPPLRVTDRSASAPTSPVAVERCRTFERGPVAAALEVLFDRIGGLARIASGKTVTVKLNITGDGRQKLRGLAAERSYQVHPHVVEVLAGLLHRAGARRIYLVESYYAQKSPAEILAAHGWDPGKIASAGGHKVVFEDTRHLGAFKDYVKLEVPWGGYAFPAYHLNRRYVETDVLVSLAKMKEHITAGITGAVKNLFGITPTALYGGDAPNEGTTENRGAVLHDGSRGVPAGVTQEHDPTRTRLPRPRESFYRVPLVTADLLGIRPVDLAIVEAIETSKGGEGPWCGPAVRPVAPGLILAGRNAVTVDAVMTAVMGFDPLAPATERPWYGYNHLELLARAGAGTHDPGRIEVVGVPLKDALFEYQPDVTGWVKKHM